VACALPVPWIARAVPGAYAAPVAAAVVAAATTELDVLAVAPYAVPVAAPVPAPWTVTAADGADAVPVADAVPGEVSGP
jgi:alpha/beta superfamily hydrolase